MGRGPSELQKEILLGVWRCRDAAEGAWGVAWWWVLDENPMPGLSAAISRALRRLEDRGLVRRRNQRSGDRYAPKFDPSGRISQHICLRFCKPDVGRTTHVRLTAEGERVAEELDRARNG